MTEALDETHLFFALPAQRRALGGVIIRWPFPIAPAAARSAYRALRRPGPDQVGPWEARRRIMADAATIIRGQAVAS